MRRFLYQAGLLAAVGLVLGFFVYNTAHNLEARRIASGFGFLGREAGFEIGESTFVAYSAADSYARALFVGLANTFRVAAIGIVLATLLGTVIGLARLSRNWLIAKLAGAYVEVMRNVPLLVQLFLWYAVIAENLPGPREALAPLPGAYLSNRGIAFSVPLWQSAYAWVLGAALCGAALAVGVSVWARKLQAESGAQFPSGWVGLALVLALPGAAFAVSGVPLAWDEPVLAGFNFTGGAALTPEFAALLTGLTIYTAAFIAEIVRAGVLAVDRGQFEAADSLGLPRRRAMRLVILPQALRVIVPPMTSQYLNLTKNSSLAVAIGYPDLVSIANTTMNQTGQAVEGIAIIMAVYLSISLAISALMNWYNRRIALRGASR